MTSDEMIRDFSGGGHAAVDLETACLSTLGELLDLELAAIRIVSDYPEKKKLDPERTREASFSQKMGIAVMGLTGFGRASGRSHDNSAETRCRDAGKRERLQSL